MKFLVVDDEPLAVMRLQKMLEDIGIQDIITANNGQQAIAAVKQYHPHIVFLDIQMPVVTGIAAAQQIKLDSPETKIIFCTAFDEYALQAFDLSASDYLLKPVTMPRLKQALEKTDYLDKHSFSFQHGKDFTSLEIADIYCFVATDKTTIMHCQLGTVFIDESLLTLEEMFPKRLYRINRNALVNISELYGIHREKSRVYAKLKSIDYQPQISRRNIAKVKEFLK